MTKIVIGLLWLITNAFGQVPVRYEVVGISVAELDSAYSLDGEYPRIKGLNDTLVEAQCNATIYSLVSEWINSFKSEARQAYEELRSDSNVMAGSYLNVGYSADLRTDRILTLDLSWGGMVAYNAHPASESFSVVFDLSNGQQIRLEDLFEPHSNYLDTLDHYCIPRLFKEGAESKIRLKDHYGDFTLDEDSLTITYNVNTLESYGSYQIPYSVTIPYKALRNVLKKHGPLESLLK